MAAATSVLLGQVAPAPQVPAAAKNGRPPRREISARNPLFMIEEGVEMWNLLPEDFRVHCSAETYTGDRDRRVSSATPDFFAGLERAQKAGIPVVLAVQGDEDDGPPVLLENVARGLEQFPNFIGCRSCELTCGPGFSASERRYLIDLIKLCGEHGALVNWMEMGYPYERDHIFTIAGRDNAIFPLLKAAVDYDLIPDREQARAKIKVAYQDSGAPGTELDAPGEALYRPLYGGDTPDEVIMKNDLSPDLFPRTGRYYFLPVLPKLAPAATHTLFPNIIVPHQFPDAESECACFDKLYPVESTGQALVFHIDDAWYVTNWHENQNIAQAFRFHLAPGLAGIELSGVLQPHSLLLVKVEARKLYLQANNYVVDTHILDEPRPETFNAASYLEKYVSHPDDAAMRITTLQMSVASGEKPALTYSTKHGTVKSQWNAEDGSMLITLKHNGPVEMTVGL